MDKFSKDPEALHDIANGTERKVGDKFVTPGIPDAALVSREQMTQAKINGAKTDTMRKGIITK